MTHFALWNEPPAGDDDRKGKSNIITIQITESALTEHGLPPGRFLRGKITNVINPDRLMAVIKGDDAIVGRIQIIDSESFKIGTQVLRFDEVNFFAVITGIRQQVVNS